MSVRSKCYIHFSHAQKLKELKMYNPITSYSVKNV
jgi:hypothetical protein